MISRLPYWALYCHVSVRPPPHQLVVVHHVHRHVHGIRDANHRVLSRRHLLVLPAPPIMRPRGNLGVPGTPCRSRSRCAFLLSQPWRLWTGRQLCLLLKGWRRPLLCGSRVQLAVQHVDGGLQKRGIMKHKMWDNLITDTVTFSDLARANPLFAHANSPYGLCQVPFWRVPSPLLARAN